MVGGALAGLAGAYLSVAQAKMPPDTLISGRGHLWPLSISGTGIL